MESFSVRFRDPKMLNGFCLISLQSHSRVATKRRNGIRAASCSRAPALNKSLICSADKSFLPAALRLMVTGGIYHHPKTVSNNSCRVHINLWRSGMVASSRNMRWLNSSIRDVRCSQLRIKIDCFDCRSSLNSFNTYSTATLKSDLLPTEKLKGLE